MVQNRADHIKAALEHLNNPITYRLLDGDPTSCICSNNDFLHQDLFKKGLLDKDTITFCSPPKKRFVPLDCICLKKHKNPMGILPIVSSCESPTENISQFLDFWLQPLMKALPSYLKNTTELIELKDLSVERDTILVIPHQEGIEACRKALQSNNESNPSRPDISRLYVFLK